MKYAKVACVSLLLFAGCWLSGHDSVRAQDDPSDDNSFEALIDQIFDRYSVDDSDAPPEAEVRPFPGKLSRVLGHQQVFDKSLAERFGVSGLYSDAREDWPESQVIWASPEVDKLQRLLAQPLKKEGFQFKDMPLSEVADFVRKEYGLKVQLDPSSFDDLGLSEDEKLDANLSEMSLGAALKLTLHEVELTYILVHDTVVIASEDESFAWPLVGIYPVGDLLEVKQGAASSAKTQGLTRYPEDIDHLIEIIQATCYVDGWGDGDGYIAAMQPSLLVVRHREEVHLEIQNLLSALRLARQHRFALPLESRENGKRSGTRAQRKEKPKQSSKAVEGGGGGFGGGGGRLGGEDFGGGGAF